MEATLSVRNITKIFRLTTDEDRKAGQAWYREARLVAESLDPDNPARAAAVLAVLSPQLSWKRNVKLAQDAYAGRPLGCLGRNAEKARRILAGEDMDSVVSGPKVRAFWLTIADPYHRDAVVVDRHAVAIAANRVLSDDERQRLISGKRYDAACDLYRRAARIISKELGEEWTPAMVQAATWCYWRRERALANHG